MNDQRILNFKSAAARFDVSVGTLYNMIPEYGITVVEIRTGAKKRSKKGIPESEIQRVVAQMISEADNQSRAGRDVLGENTCQKSATVIEMASTKGQTRRTGKHHTSTSAAEELGALLKLKTAEKPKHS